jgi:hypothetical protein
MRRVTTVHPSVVARSVSASVLIVAAVACGSSDRPVPAESPTSSQRVGGESTAAVDRVAADNIISASGIGPIRLGMTLDEARGAARTATFQRASDGDGAALVEVTLARGAAMVLWAEEDDADAAIDWSKRIVNIETFNPAFRTSAGIFPGSLVTDAERAYGRTRAITLSEIESRQYIQFEAQPAWLTFRLDYTGTFQGDSRTTKAYSPGAKIHSIAIASPSM